MGVRNPVRYTGYPGFFCSPGIRDFGFTIKILCLCEVEFLNHFLAHQNLLNPYLFRRSGTRGGGSPQVIYFPKFSHTLSDLFKIQPSFLISWIPDSPTDNPDSIPEIRDKGIREQAHPDLRPLSSYCCFQTQKLTFAYPINPELRCMFLQIYPNIVFFHFHLWLRCIHE